MGDRAFVLRSNLTSDLTSDPRYENYRSSPGIQVIALCPGLQACVLKARVQNTFYTCFISWVGGSGKQISDDIFWVVTRNNFEGGSDQRNKYRSVVCTFS